MCRELNPIRVSAVIPTLNRRDYVARAIDSILAQSVPVDEIIVVDDEHSTDQISEFLESCYGSRVRVVPKQGGGLSGARRRGIQEARGEWIAFLDSDDDWPQDRNKEFLEAAALVPSDVAWIFGNTRVIRDGGHSTTFYEEFGLAIHQSPHVFADPFSVQFPFQFGVLSSSFIRRDVLLELDCFKEPLQHSEDVLAGFQVACRYRFAALPSVVGSYFRTSDLAENSALLKGLWGPDYFRARLLAFAAAVESGRKTPWNMLYAAEVRGFCKMQARQGRVPRKLAAQQFRYGGVSAKGIVFLCAAMLGRKGIQAWNAMGEIRRNRFFPEKVSPNRKTGFQAYAESAFEKKLSQGL
jgi:glycosyltransferase involved in cell wall biosynthesis